MRVLSLFDGMACGYEALLRAWIKVDKYYASEIDKYAIQIAMKNHPDIIQVGDVTKLKGEDFKDVDMIIGGSPCQGFSMAWKMLNFEDPRSKLFFEFVRLVKEIKPKYFLLENVKMKKEFQDVISEYMWVKPIEINSALLSAQNRKRLYRTNIPNVSIPEDKGIRVKDILETNVDEKYYLSEAMLNCMMWINQKPSKYPRGKRFEQSLRNTNEKWIANCVSTHAWSRPVDNFIIEENKILVNWAAIRNQHTKNWVETQLNIRKDEKSNCVVSSYADKLNQVKIWPRIRKLTPIECERLQTMPDNYTEWVSDTQRYKMLWNWWTCDVIAHIFSFIKTDNG